MTGQVKMKNISKLSVECPICYTDFQAGTTNSEAPLLLENCGHSLCKMCCDNLKGTNTNFQCPFCKVNSSPKPNTSLIELLQNGYLTCSGCYYPLRSKIKECIFNKKGDFCFDCARDVKGGLKNFSLIRAIESYSIRKDDECVLKNPKCQKKYDLKIFEKSCSCDNNFNTNDLFSKFFLKNNLFDTMKYEKIAGMVYEDTKALYEESKNTGGAFQKMEEIRAFKANTNSSFKSLQQSWENFNANHLMDLEKNEFKSNFEKYSKNYNDDLFFKVKTESKNFSNVEIDTIFQATETNKLLQKSTKHVFNSVSNGKNHNKKMANSLHTLASKFRKAAQEIEKFAKLLDHNKIDKDGNIQKVNFNYLKHPFIDINPTEFE